MAQGHGPISGFPGGGSSSGSTTAVTGSDAELKRRREEIQRDLLPYGFNLDSARLSSLSESDIERFEELARTLQQDQEARWRLGDSLKGQKGNFGNNITVGRTGDSNVVLSGPSYGGFLGKLSEGITAPGALRLFLLLLLIQLLAEAFGGNIWNNKHKAIQIFKDVAARQQPEVDVRAVWENGNPVLKFIDKSTGKDLNEAQFQSLQAGVRAELHRQGLNPREAGMRMQDSNLVSMSAPDPKPDAAKATTTTTAPAPADTTTTTPAPVPADTTTTRPMADVSVISPGSEPHTPGSGSGRT